MESNVITVTLITAIIGAVCGIIGTLLGIINIWHQLQRSRVRLKIKLCEIISLGYYEDYDTSFEVINLSEFPVTVVDVGFLMTKSRSSSLGFVDGAEPNGKLPLRLEPRSSYNKLFCRNKITFNQDSWKSVRKLYARTECGTKHTEKSKFLKQFIRKKPKNIGQEERKAP